MSEVLRRTIYTETRIGRVRFFDWAKVETELGVMAEPYFPAYSQIGQGYANYDDNDSMTKVDQIKPIDLRNDQNWLGDHALLHGGFLMPRG